MKNNVKTFIMDLTIRCFSAVNFSIVHRIITEGNVSMPVYKIGYLIKERRLELGITQEELADGICAVTTLSRIENGERIPSKDYFERLIQRLGVSDIVFYTTVDKNTLYLHELKFKIRDLIARTKYKEALELLNDYSSKANMSLRFEKQFVLLYNTIAANDSIGLDERLCKLREAVSLTCPRYTDGFIPNLLSYEEIIALNNIAICYMQMGNYDKAISILSHIKKHYESGFVNREECLKTQTMVLYNLSKCYGLTGKYDECIEICDLGIKIACETGRCGCLSQLHYNRAWSLSKRMLHGDMEQAENAARKAIFAAVSMGDKHMAEHYKKFYFQNFPQLNLLLNYDIGAIT